MEQVTSAIGSPTTIIPESIIRFCHDHIGCEKITRIFFDVVGALALLAPCFGLTLPLICVAAAGALIIVINELVHLSLSLLGFFPHDISKHTFEETTCNRSSLTYNGHIPMLTIDADSPHQSGFDQGYILAPQIFRMITRMRWLSGFVGTYRPGELTASLERIKRMIPEEYLQEMQGIVDGMSRWENENSTIYSRSITLDELLVYHLMPDALHVCFPQLGGMGCTVVIDRDDEGNIVYGRHTDWASLGIFGELTLMMHRKNRETYSFLHR